MYNLLVCSVSPLYRTTCVILKVLNNKFIYSFANVMSLFLFATYYSRPES